MEKITEFLWKIRTRIIIVVFSVIFTILLILCSTRSFYKYLYDDYNYRNSSLIMFSLNNHQDDIEDMKNIKKYTQALYFNRGNNLKTISYVDVTGFTEANTIPLDQQITWEGIEYENDVIMAMPASAINRTLEYEEVILMTSEHYEKNATVKSSVGRRMQFVYNGEKISLRIKGNVFPSKYNGIYISDELFNKLVKESRVYVYIINAKDYRAVKKISKKWNKLEDNKKYKLDLKSYAKADEPYGKNYYTKKLTTLNVVLAIFAVFSIFIINVGLYVVIMNETAKKRGKKVTLEEVNLMMKKFIGLDVVSILIASLLSVIITWFINVANMYSISLVHLLSLLILLICLGINEFIVLYLYSKGKIKRITL